MTALPPEDLRTRVRRALRDQWMRSIREQVETTPDGHVEMMVDAVMAALARPGLVDGRAGAAVVRRMWRRWWMGLGWEAREHVCAELCMLPRGTGSDDGWLVIRP